jgi:hypothetical protein
MPVFSSGPTLPGMPGYTGEKPEHDLHVFMRQVTSEIASEYARIYTRTQEDPGTAGDQGEENWATILRDWLPPKYQIVTKGRLIGHEGITSPQIDIIVLKPSYPRKLLDKKLYLAAGVAAVFECKNTIKADDIKSSYDRAKKFKGLYPERYGSPYKETRSPLIYGILSHSHNWKSGNSKPLQNLQNTLEELHLNGNFSPREFPDLVCVADIGAWDWSVMAIHWSDYEFSGEFAVPASTATCGLSTSMMCHSPAEQNQSSHFTPVGALISNLIRKLAWEDLELRDLADYFQQANVGGSASGKVRVWPLSTYSSEVAKRVASGHVNTTKWSDWSMMQW